MRRLPLLVLLFLFFFPAANSAEEPDHTALAFGLRQRSQTFPSGVLEARETRWEAPRDYLEKLETTAKLLTATPVPAEKAEEFAAKFERALLEILGTGKQRAWAYFGNSAGAKLLEIPLEPGEKPETPMQSATDGQQWRGFQNGITVLFDAMQKIMLLSPGASDSVMLFRPSDMDPTLHDFDLFLALKKESHNILIAPAAANVFRVSLRGKKGNSRYYFHSAETAPFLIRTERHHGSHTLLAKEYFGTYGNITNAPQAFVPYSALEILLEDPLQIRLFTVTRWTMRPIRAEELQIKVPKDTHIIREGMP